MIIEILFRDEKRMERAFSMKLEQKMVEVITVLGSYVAVLELE